MQMLMCRGADVQRFRGHADKVQRCKGAEVQRCMMHRCRCTCRFIVA